MRNKKIWLAICICGLFLGGCGNKKTSQQTGDGMAPEATPMETQQPGDAQKDELPEVGDDNKQTEGRSLSDAGNAQTGRSSSIYGKSETGLGGMSTPGNNKAKSGETSTSSNSKAKSGGTSTSSSKAKSGGTSTSSNSKAKTGGTSTSSKSKAKTGRASTSNSNKVKSRSLSSSANKVRAGSATFASGNTAANSAKRTKKEAFAIALKHADVKESSVTSKRIKKDYEDGKAVYDIEFHANGKEYDYDVRISDGKILKSGYEIENASSGQETSQGKVKITKSQAKKIALANVRGAKKISIKKDRENGRVVYESKINYGKQKHKIDIDAYTGKIVSWKIEYK